MRRLVVGGPIVIAAVVAIVGLAHGGGPPAAAQIRSNAPTYSSLAELVTASDVVVEATVVDSSDGRIVTGPDDPTAGFHTRLLRLAVTRTLVGVAPTPLIVEEPAALLDGTPVVVDGMEPLGVGEQAVWYLVAGDDPSLPYYAVINGQGRVTTDLDEAVDATLATG